MLKGRILPLCGAQLLAGSSAWALEGLVVSKESGEPQANVEIVVVGGTGTARSDREGRFVLVPDPHPPFELLLILSGGRYTKPLWVEEVPAAGPLVVEVEPLVTESVTATAGAAPGIRAAPAGGTTLVTRDDLRSRAPRNLTEALENVPGVSSVSEGHAAVPAIRGLAQARSLILIDGARVTAERRIGPSATFLDPFVVEGIEVARGPGSVAYGSDAFGGVILAKTRRPRPGSDFNVGFSGTGGVGVPQARAGLSIESGIDERSGLLVSGHWREFNDYDSPEGEVRNSGSEDHGFVVRYAYVLERGVLSVGLQGDYGRDIERPRTNSDVVRFYYPKEDSLRFTSSYEGGPALGLDATEIALFVGDYRLVTDQDQFATETEPRHIERADVSANDLGLRATGDKHWGQTRASFGVDLNGRFNLEAEDVVIDYDAAGQQVNHDTQSTIERARLFDAGLFVSGERPLGSVVSLAAGLRFDRVESKNEDGFFGDLSRTESEPSGFAALTLGAFSGFTTTLQYAHGFREARLSDRYFRGVTGAGFITGNPELDPETSDQLDLALRHTTRRARSALYIYEYRIGDLIERFEDPGQPDFFFFRNRDRARIRGIELETQLELPRRVALQVAASLAEGESRDDGEPLDDIMPLSLVVQARKELGARSFVQARGAFLGDRDEPGPNEVETDGYTLLDAAAGFRINGNLELRLTGRNLLDESYALSTDGRSPVAPGISGALTLDLTF